MFCAAADNATNKQINKKKPEFLRIVRLRRGYVRLGVVRNNVFILDILSSAIKRHMDMLCQAENRFS